MPFICPLSNFSVHPAAKVFHYGIEVSLIRIAKKELNTVMKYFGSRMY
jgi:hypothetical protein